MPSLVNIGCCLFCSDFPNAMWIGLVLRSSNHADFYVQMFPPTPDLPPHWDFDAQENKIVSKEEEHHIPDYSNLPCQSILSPQCAFLQSSQSYLHLPWYLSIPRPMHGFHLFQAQAYIVGQSFTHLLKLAEALPRAPPPSLVPLPQTLSCVFHLSLEMFLNILLLSSGLPEMRTELTLSP